jgi:hypothetical protein
MKKFIALSLALLSTYALAETKLDVHVKFHEREIACTLTAQQPYYYTEQGDLLVTAVTSAENDEGLVVEFNFFTRDEKGAPFLFCAPVIQAQWSKEAYLRLVKTKEEAEKNQEFSLSVVATR